MSVRATGAVWTHSTLDRRTAAFVLLLAIADRAHDDGTTWRDQADFLDRARCSDRHFRRCISVAEAAGELERRIARDGRIVWRIILPDLELPDLERLAGHGLELPEPFTRSAAGVHDQRTPSSVPTAAHGRPTRARSLPGNVSETSGPSGGSPPDGATVQELVAFYVDESRRRDVEPLTNVRGQIGRGVKAALAEGCTPDEIRAGLKVVVVKGLHPSTLPSCIKKRPTKGAQRGTGALAEHDLYNRGA